MASTSEAEAVTTVVQAAIARLEERLPLRARQAALPAPLVELHRLILWSLARDGRPPTGAAMDGVLGNMPRAEALARLGSDDLVVLDTAGEQVLGAYPFTTEQTPHRLTAGESRVHAMCALDALAVSPVFDLAVSIDSECAVTGEPVRVEQRGDVVEAVRPGPGLHVGVRWQQPSGCAAHSMCRDMVFLRDRDVAEHWLAEGDAGLFDLHEAVAFARGYFQPLLSSAGV